MAITFKAIATTTVGSGGVANITFNSIPQTYTDLCILTSARSEAAGAFSDELIKFNNTTTTYINRYMYGNGTIAAPGNAAYIGSGGFVAGMSGNGAAANIFGNKIIYIPDYTTNNTKSYYVDAISADNATLSYGHLLTGRWASTDAITSIVLVTDNGVDYGQYTTSTLYGIKNTV